MKLLIVIATIFAVSSALQLPINGRGPNEQIRDAIENLKKQMPCGFPEQDIPPLAPLKLEETKLNWENILIEIGAALNNLRVDGLNDFEVKDITLSVLTLKATFDFNFSSLSAQGQYFIETLLIKLFKISGKGNIDFALKNLRISGNLRLGARGDGMELTDFKIFIDLGNVKSNISGLLGGGLLGDMANRFIETAILFIIKQESVFVSQLVEEQVIGMANDYLSQFTRAEILEMITKPSEPSTCVPSAKIQLHHLLKHY